MTFQITNVSQGEKMKTALATLALTLIFQTAARADVLAPAEADAICHAKALRAAHFLAESNRPLIATFVTGKIAEISTPITYQFRYRGVSEAQYTVVAYAYPDDRSCTIGSVTNNIAGND